jgi:hypothetical protein
MQETESGKIDTLRGEDIRRVTNQFCERRGIRSKLKFVNAIFDDFACTGVPLSNFLMLRLSGR